MRTSTQDKLFIFNKVSPEFKITSSGDRLANGNLITTLVVEGEAVIIIEYKNECDGFDVYKYCDGVDINSTRQELGLRLKK